MREKTKKNKKKEAKPPKAKDVAQFVTAEGTKALNTVSNDTGAKRGVKRKKSMADTPSTSDKKRKTVEPNVRQALSFENPVGFKWNSATYSCAYDSLFSILLSVYISSKETWSTKISQQNSYLRMFQEQFDKVLAYEQSMEEARDYLRQQVHASNPKEFPVTGRDGTDLYKFCIEFFFNENQYLVKKLICKRCKLDFAVHSEDILLWHCSKFLWKNSPTKLGSYKQRKLSEWLMPLWNRKATESCIHCRKKLSWRYDFEEFPNFLTFSFENIDIMLDQVITVDEEQEYRLCGVIYFGEFHFTSRIITPDGNVWFNDGVTTGNQCKFEGNLKIINPSNMQMAHGKKCSVAVYTKV